MTMAYNFKTFKSRRNTGSSKWGTMVQSNPSLPTDIVPLSVADMEFEVAPEIINGIKKD